MNAPEQTRALGCPKRVEPRGLLSVVDTEGS